MIEIIAGFPPYLFLYQVVEAEQIELLKLSVWKARSFTDMNKKLLICKGWDYL